jgi:hypothetical protein
MDYHHLARLTVHGREQLAKDVVEGEWQGWWIDPRVRGDRHGAPRWNSSSAWNGSGASAGPGCGSRRLPV